MKHKGRKLLSFLLSLAMVMSAFAGMPAASFADDSGWSGSGTKDDPYLISSAADLELLSSTVTAAKSYSGIFFKMTSDVTVSDWSPIGMTSSAAFKGTFDGDGHVVTINGIDPDYAVSATTYYAGLFGYLKGSVYNVTVDGKISVSKNYAYVGGIAGYFMADYSSIYILNCANRADITVTGTNSNEGGITGYMNSDYAYLYNCYNDGTITASESNSKVGGINGTANGGKRYYCINNGTVAGTPGSSYATSTECYDFTTGDVPEMTQSDIDKWNESVSKWTSADSFWNLGADGKPVPSSFCSHEPAGDGVVTEPTCTEDGYITYTCKKCGASYRTVGKLALGHDMSETVKDATCTEAGSKTEKCSRCDFEETIVIPAKGHTALEGSEKDCGAYYEYKCSECSLIYQVWKDERMRVVTYSGAEVSFSTGGTYEWVYDESGDRIKSTNQKKGKTSSISVMAVKSDTDILLSFDYEASSESKYDIFSATLDAGTSSTVKLVSDKSGNDKGSCDDIKLLAGTHTVTFNYTKDISSDKNDDTAYVKNVVITPAGGCAHRTTRTEYVSAGDGDHTVKVICTDECRQELSSENEAHKLTYTHVGGSATHKAECALCGYSAVKDCDSADYCSVCGYDKREGGALNPYIIDSVDDLKALADAVNKGQDQAGKYYRLDKDLELPGDFSPIGHFESSPVNGEYAFAGNFDGNGHSITVNITDRSGSNSRVGLFGSVRGANDAVPAVIKNLVVKGSVLVENGGSNAAGIAGRAENARIENCGNMASVTNKHETSAAAGIIGRSAGNVTVTDCFNTGSISAGLISAGIIANSDSGNGAVAVLHSYNVGALAITSSEGGNIGGIIGTAYKQLTVTDCYAGNTKNYSGLNVGGITGAISQSMTITNCFWQSSDNGPKNWYGGSSSYGVKADASIFDSYTELLGADSAKKLDDAYYKVNSFASEYPLLKWQTSDGSGNVSHTHRYTVTVTDPTCSEKGFTSYVCACGYSYIDDFTEMTAHTFGAWTADEASDQGYTHTHKCSVCDAAESAECVFRWTVTEQAKPGEPGTKKGVCVYCGREITDSYEVRFDKGSGTAKDPYIISSEAELRRLAEDVNSGLSYADTYFKMSDDITVSADTPWPAIGGKDGAFSGHFDGLGHRVTFNINSPEEDFRALFGRLSGASVERVIVAGSITGGSFTAGIAGYAKDSEISYCGNEASLTGGANHTYAQNKGPDHAYTAGIAAYATGTKISFCYNRGNITNTASADDDSRYTAGIAGEAVGSSTIRYCYNNAIIKAVDTSDNYCYTAGIAGMMWTGSLTYSYNVGKVESLAEYTGAVLGSGKSTALTGGYNYYLEGSASKGAGIDEDAANGLSAVEADALKSVDSDAGKVLESGFAADGVSGSDINNGYFILKWEKDAGFEYQPIYEISTKADLELFRNIVRTGYDYRGETVTLKNDISLNDGELSELWPGIGDVSGGHLFAGTFDAGGNEINGLVLYAMDETAGFFNAISETAVVKGLTLRGIATGYNSIVGSVAGLNYGGTIENCVSYVDITTDQQRTLNEFIGGIAGQNVGTIKNCENYGEITLYNGAMDGPAGGIAGNNEGSIVSCSNYGVITGADKTGGIAGKCEMLYAKSSDILIKDCGNYAQVRGFDYVGGIVGASFSLPVTIEGCTNKKNVTAQGDYVGGIIAYMGSGSDDNTGDITYGKAEINNCYNLGEVTSLCAPSLDADSGTTTATGYYIGGIVGRAMLRELKAVNCYNTGMVRGASDNTEELGAIAGFMTGAAENCYYRDIIPSVYGNKMADIRMRSVNMPELLGSAYKNNTGYPLLNWEISETAEEDMMTVTFSPADGDGAVTWNAAKNSSVELPANIFGGDVWKLDGKNYTPGDNFMTGVVSLTFTSGTASGSSSGGGGGTSGGSGGGGGGTSGGGASSGGSVGGGSAVTEPKPDTGNTVKKLYDDVNSSDWFNDAVNYVTEKDLMSGTGASTFSPKTETTRGMLMTILARMSGEDTSGSSPWYKKGLDWAVAKGVSDGTAPEKLMTREQLATMLYRYAGSPDTNGSLAAFNDAGDVSGYAQTAVKWAVEKGIVTGKSANTLDPKSSATRAELAAMIQRYTALTA